MQSMAMPDLPETYFVAAALTAVLTVYGLFNLRAAWAIPYVAVVLTIGAWYLIEPLYFPEEFRFFDTENIATAYDTVLIALLSFAAAAPASVKLTRPKRADRVLTSAHVPAQRVLVMVAALWLLLLAYGTYRMQGNIFGALFPIGGRSSVNMWSRGAGASGGDAAFIVSAASYLYLLCLASFGIFYSIVPRGLYTKLAFVLILSSWPYVFLQGSRNLVLAVVLPTLFSYLLFARRGLVVKGVIFGGTFLLLQFVFGLMIRYRNEGFGNIDIGDVQTGKHLGLNMASELIYCVQFVRDGTLDLSYGGRYLEELANAIPRAIWPDKPLVGIEYALARGFGGAANDIGVNATISSGMIGGGILNFGLIFGPIVVGLAMAIWVGLLARFRQQITPLRLALYLIGLGLTFNLGRDITLLVLWPLVFGYIVVRLIEWRASNAPSPRRAATGRAST